MITKLLESLGKLIIVVISSTGYFGVFFFMAMESMIAPIPSELVMPFAGFLAADGRFSFTLVIIASSLGSIVGSLISYYMGKYGGNPLVIKFGKYLFLDVSDLKKTEAWFAKRGASASSWPSSGAALTPPASLAIRPPPLRPWPSVTASTPSAIPG